MVSALPAADRAKLSAALGAADEPTSCFAPDRLEVGAQPTSILDAVDEWSRLNVASFFDVPSLGRWACCSNTSSTDIALDVLWAETYNATRRAQGSVSESVRALIERPFGQDAVDWRVSVMRQEQQQSGAFVSVPRSGTVRRFDDRRGAYLVVYDDEGLPGLPEGTKEVWEVEWSARVLRQGFFAGEGRSRIQFLGLAIGAEPRQPTASLEGEERPEVAAQPQQLLRLGSWRAEMQHTVAYTPSQAAKRLTDHTDEVLYVVFSPCGSRLATCSRDKTTIIYRVGSRNSVVRHGVLRHQAASVYAQWWPEAPHKRIIVSTEGAQSAPSAAEVWDLDSCAMLLRVPAGGNRPTYDVFSSVVRWDDELVLFANRGRIMSEMNLQQFSLCRVPQPGAQPQILGNLRLEGGVNYYHYFAAAPIDGSRGRFAALTGQGNWQCDELAILDLADARKADQEEGDRPEQLWSFKPRRTRTMPKCALLSLCWARGGELLLVNTRPRVGSAAQLAAPSSGQQPAPQLSTAIQLLVLDACTLDVLSCHGGHHAFTTSEFPFILHAESWASADFLASGGEDHCVHVWHRRHQRQLQRLEGHSKEVNAVSWCEEQRLLASASDDHTVILWSTSAAS